MLETKVVEHTVSDSRQARMAAGVAALLFGSFMLFGVGFANSETVHNAAHDTRHAFTFPCH